jgi:hypothetical protein
LRILALFFGDAAFFGLFLEEGSLQVFNNLLVCFLELAQIVTKTIISKFGDETFECTATHGLPTEFLGLGDDACPEIRLIMEIVINISFVQKLNGSIGLDVGVLGVPQVGGIG